MCMCVPCGLEQNINQKISSLKLQDLNRLRYICLKLFNCLTLHIALLEIIVLGKSTQTCLNKSKLSVVCNWDEKI